MIVALCGACFQIGELSPARSVVEFQGIGKGSGADTGDPGASEPSEQFSFD